MKGVFDLVGRTDTNDTPSKNVGWVVSWQNDTTSANSVTAWSGELQRDDATGEWRIVATWLLTIEGPAETDWTSTLVGRDTFTRNAPSDETVRRREKFAASHPLAASRK